MKKLICVVAALLVLVCAVPAFAAGEETFEITELNMRVAIPNAEQMMIGVTDGDYNAAMSEWLAAQGMTEEDFNAYVKQNMIAFTAMDPSGSYEYSISSMENKDTRYYYDMATLSDAELNEVMGAASGIKEAENISVGEIKKINGNPYLAAETDGLADGTGVWISMYSTVKNGKYVYIRLLNYEGPATQEQRDVLKSIVQSAEYENIPAVGKTYASEKASNPFSGVGGAAIRGAIFGGAGALVAGLIAWSAGKRKKKRMAAQGVPYGGDMQQSAPREGYTSVAPPNTQQQPGQPPSEEENDRHGNP